MTVFVVGDNSADDSTITATEETDIRSTSATTNFGTNASFQTTKYSAGNDANGLIKFPGLSEISSPVTVSSAVLTLYWEAGNTGHTVTAKRLLPAWTEAGATWNKYDGTNDWPGSGGGLTDTTDRSSTVAGTIATVTTAANNFSDDAFSADVEGMINGTFNNYGWHLERTDSEDDSQYINWGSAEGTDGHRPYLTVTYTAGSDPEGDIIQLLFGVQCASVGFHHPEGAMVQTLSPVSQAGSAVMTYVCAVVQTLASVAQAGSSVLEYIGSAVQTLATTAQDAAAAFGEATGDAIQTLASTAQAGVAALLPQGTGAQLLAGVQQVASGVAVTTGAAVQTLAGVVQSAIGEGLSLAKFFSRIMQPVMQPIFRFIAFDPSEDQNGN